MSENTTSAAGSDPVVNVQRERLRAFLWRDLKEMPLETALQLSKGAYGGDTFARLMAAA